MANPFLQALEDEKKKKPSVTAAEKVKATQESKNPFLAAIKQVPITKAPVEEPTPPSTVNKLKAGISSLVSGITNKVSELTKKKDVLEVPKPDLTKNVDLTQLSKLTPPPPTQTSASIYDLASKSPTTMLTPEAQAGNKKYLQRFAADQYKRSPELQRIGETTTSLVAGAGDVLEGTGKIATWLGNDGLAKKLIDKGGELQTFGPDTTEFQKDGKVDLEWKDAFNPRLYTTLMARGSSFTLAMLPLAFMGGAGGTYAAGAIGLGKVGTIILTALGGSALSTPFEAATEAGGTYDEMIKSGKTREEANNAANKTFKGNALLLGLTNALQFIPFAGKGGKEVVKTGLKKVATTAAGEFVSEGGEEVAQSNISKWSQGKPLDITSKDARTEFVLGGLQGLVFSAGGAVIDTDTGNDVTAQVVQNGIEQAKMTISEIETRIIEEVPGIKEEIVKNGTLETPKVAKILEENKKQVEFIVKEVVSVKVQEEGKAVSVSPVVDQPTSTMKEEKPIQAETQPTKPQSTVGEVKKTKDTKPEVKTRDKSLSEILKEHDEKMQEYEKDSIDAETKQALRSLYSDNEISLFNRVKSMARAKDVAEGDVETLYAKNPELAERAFQAVKEKEQGITTNDEAYDYILSLPTKAETVAPVEPKLKAPEKTPTKPTNEKTLSRVYERMQAEHPTILEEDLEYTKINLQKEADKAMKLLESDKQKAYRIAMGEEVSSELTSTSANIVMAEKALDEGNTELYAKLITSRSLAQTRRGQEIVSERGSISDNSTSRYVKELLASKMDKLGKEYLSNPALMLKSNREKATAAVEKEVTKIQKKIKRGKLDVKTALGLLEELRCV